VVSASGGISIGRLIYRRREVASRPIRLAPKPAYLVGREQLLEDLHQRLSGHVNGPQVVELCGLGGVGKTSLALEYAHRHLDEIELVWQFQAENPTALAAGFGDLADQLGARDVLDAVDPVARVHGILAARPEEWLLIFDNAPDAASIRATLPPAGNGQVIITTQNPLWPSRTAVQVPVLDQDTAAKFLMSRTHSGDRESARTLAEELGGLPLALEQAAAYIQAAGLSIAEYLAAFRRGRNGLLDRGEVAEYSGQVATTWSLAFSQLQDRPQATGLLRVLAFCAPEAIPLRLLFQGQQGLEESLPSEIRPLLAPLLTESVTVDDGVAALRRYSLVGQPISGSVSVHRLVQLVTRSQLSERQTDAWRQATEALITAALPSDPRYPPTWNVYAALLPHAQAVLPVNSEPITRIAIYLGHSGSYAAARSLQQQIVDVTEQDRGAEHPQSLAARGSLACWTGEAGDAAAARDQFAALIPVAERVLGAEHPETLADRGNLAYWTGEAGDPPAARDQYAALLPITERVFGADHAETLNGRFNLAHWTGEAGDAAAARDQLTALLPLREQMLGADHPETLNGRFQLARWTGEAGDRAAARDQLTALLPLREQVLGADHPETLHTHAELAFWTGEAGNAAAARDRLTALLPAIARIFGADHPDTLTTGVDLAAWTGEAGDAATARDQVAALLPRSRRIFGPEHPATLIVYSIFARWTGEAGDPAAARDQLQALLPIREQVRGTEHPDALNARASLARWTGEAGDPVAARD
jgi:hypothetical protein